MTSDEAQNVLSISPKNKNVLHPYLIGDDLLSLVPPQPNRYVIDFQGTDLHTATTYKELFEIVQTTILPDRQAAAKAEEKRNREVLSENPRAHVNLHHKNFLNRWWMLSYARADLITKIGALSRYIVCSRVTKRPVFEFIDPSIRPGDALQVFTLEDDYSFGILQSFMHWAWFTAKCSTLTERFRYTSDTVFDTFPWPQNPTKRQIQAVAKAAVQLRSERRDLMQSTKCSLRQLYRTLELPGENSLRIAHERLDHAVRAAYGIEGSEDTLAHLLALNDQVAKAEQTLRPRLGPGLPPLIKKKSDFLTHDRLSVHGYRLS